MPPAEVDPFELPDWLAEGEVLWQATDERGHRDGTATVHGRITPLAGGAAPLTVDLLAVDVSWPKPVCDEATRHLAHEAWHYGQVALIDRDGRITLAVPCLDFSSDQVCEAVRRFSRAVGADPAHFLVQLRL
jgi:hypothetical protein